MTEEEFKKLLEEKYKEWYTEETDDYGDSLHWQALLVIEEIYTDIFGQEEFNEFIKRREDEEERINSEILEKLKVLGDSIKPSDYENNDDYEREEQEKLGEELRWTLN